MTKDESVNILKYLAAKYIDDGSDVLSLYGRIDAAAKNGGSPVKGVMYEILEKKNRKFSEFDRNLVSDLEYYFG